MINWEEISESIEESFDGLSIGAPVLVENLPKKSDEKTLVMLLELDDDDETPPLVMGMNIISVKQRLLFTAYYKQYASKETITQVRDKCLLTAQKIKQANQ